MAENNGEEHVMSEEEFQALYQRGLDFFAEVKNRGGMWVMEPWCFTLNSEMRKRGLPIFTLDDERVECRVREIKAEKAKKREEDPEGYKQAQKRYIDLLKQQLEESFSQELGSEDNLNNTGEIEEDQEDTLFDRIEQLDSAETELYQFESKRRNWRDELAELKIKVGDKKQGIIENLPDDQRRAYDITGELARLRRAKQLDDALGFDAGWHPADTEFHMSDIYRDAADNSRRKIADLEEEMKELPTINMSDILKSAIEAVELTMEDFQDAKAHQPDTQSITNEIGVEK